MPIQPPPALAHMQASEHADSIYYADLFRINGKVWALTGIGKSAAGRIATDKVREHDICRDSVALLRDGDKLMGQYDPGALHAGEIDALHALHHIEVMVYCFGEQETAKAYAAHPLELHPVSAKDFGLLLTHSMYPAYIAPSFFSRAELTSLQDPVRRLRRFNELMSGVVGTQWLTAPWTPDVDAKAALYKTWG